jgi:LPS O-antigen subunit length determinant protein (WzzB/FepE family)
MQHTINTKDHGPEDIDIILLMERAILFFKRYRNLFIGSAIAGIALGLIFFFCLPKSYKSKMIVHSFMLTNQEEIEISSNWNDLLKSGEYETLSHILICRKETLQKVKSIKTAEIQKVFTPVNPNGFSVEVTVADNGILSELEKGIVFGFENSPYVRDRIETKKAELKDLINKTSTEVLKLDSTKELIENILKGKGSSSSSFIINGSDINRQWIDMNQKLLSLKEELQFTSAVQVLQDFSSFSHPAGPKASVWVIVGLLVFLSLAYLYALFNSISGKIRNKPESKSLS